MTGTSVIPRSIFRASEPSRSGSPRSRTTTSKRKWATSRSASSAVPTLRTVYEASVRCRISAERTNWSSSTTRTLAMGGTVRHTGDPGGGLWTTPAAASRSASRLARILSRTGPGPVPDRDTSAAGEAVWADDAQRTRTRTGLAARHRRGGHAVVVGCPHGDGGHRLHPAPRPVRLCGRLRDAGVQAGVVLHAAPDRRRGRGGDGEGRRERRGRQGLGDPACLPRREVLLPVRVGPGPDTDARPDRLRPGEELRHQGRPGGVPPRRDL